MSKPLILGLTGSIGMGKSTVVAMLRDLGVPVFDSDQAVHQLQGADGICVERIERAFPGTTGPGGVDRRRLGAAVFGNPLALKRLEAIIHPEVAALRQAFLAEHSAAPLVVFDIPLLFESARDQTGKHGIDAVVVVSASSAQQRERVLARPGMTSERFEQILALQMPDARKRALADYVIDTGLSLENTRLSVRQLLQGLIAAR